MAEGHESFGQLLRRRRLAGGWTQEQLAERAGISPEAVGTLERGTRRTPHPGTAARLADALGLTGEDRSAFLAAIRSRIPAEPHSAAPGGTLPPQLPATYSPFIGREQEQAEVLHLLQASRLLTLTGPGGVGKTRLALAVTAQAAALFPDAACFVPLAGVGDPRHLPAAIADAVDAGSAGTGSVEQRLDRALEGKRVLLVLDNIEHLAAGAPQIAGLLDRHPGITLLVTSRIPCGCAPNTATASPRYPFPISIAISPRTRSGVTMPPPSFSSDGGPPADVARPIETCCERWPRSVSVWTAFPWRSNWPRRALPRSPSRRCCPG